MFKRIILAFSFLSLSLSIDAKDISIDPQAFMHSIEQAENNPDFIEHRKLGDGSLIVTFRAEELDHDGMKVVIEKSFNASETSMIRYGITQSDLSCADKTIQRTFYFFNVNGKLLTMKEQDSNVLALNTKLGEVACSEN